MVGREYIARIASFANALAAGRVLCRVSAPSTGVLLIKRAWFGQISNSNLNEINALQFVRLSTDGSGGAAMVFEERAPGEPAFSGTGAAHDADGWTEPTIANTLDEIPFNLAGGCEWAPTDEDGYVLVPPSARFGLAIARAPSGSMTWAGGLVIQELS